MLFMMILERRSLKKSQIINKLIVHIVMKVVSIKLSRVAYDMSKYLGGILASPGVDPSDNADADVPLSLLLSS